MKSSTTGSFFALAGRCQRESPSLRMKSFLSHLLSIKWPKAMSLICGILQSRWTPFVRKHGMFAGKCGSAKKTLLLRENAPWPSANLHEAWKDDRASNDSAEKCLPRNASSAHNLRWSPIDWPHSQGGAQAGPRRWPKKKPPEIICARNHRSKIWTILLPDSKEHSPKRMNCSVREGSDKDSPNINSNSNRLKRSYNQFAPVRRSKIINWKYLFPVIIITATNRVSYNPQLIFSNLCFYFYNWNTSTSPT